MNHSIPDPDSSFSLTGLVRHIASLAVTTAALWVASAVTTHAEATAFTASSPAPQITAGAGEDDLEESVPTLTATVPATSPDAAKPISTANSTTRRRSGAAAPMGSSIVEIKRVSGGKVNRTELEWWAYQVLVNNPDLELLLKYLNTDSGWAFGSLQAKNFRYTASRASLATMIKAVSTSGVGVNSTIRVRENGADLGTRNTTRYVLEIVPSRKKGVPYTAIVLCGRDLNSGYYFTRVVVREFANGDSQNCHEYAVRGGKVVRLSNKKGETLLLRAFAMAGGQTKEAFAKSTLPAMQKAPSLYKQVQGFLTTDRNAGLNDTASATITVQTSSQEGWWAKIKTKLLEQLKSAAEKVFKKLLEQLADYLKAHWAEIVKLVGSYITSGLSGIAGALGDILSGIGGWFGF